MADYKEIIISDHKIMIGKPVIKGTRITVELILRKMAEGASVDDLLDIYPSLDHNKINACLEYAAELIAGEEILENA